MKKTSCILTASIAMLAASSSAQALPAFAQPAATPVAWLFGWFKSDEEKAAEKAEAEAKATTESAAESAAEADADSGINVEELKKQVVSTLALIESKRGELEAVSNALKAIPLPEQMSAKAREYQAQASNLMTQINDLREQANGYISQLKAMGVPVDQWLE